MSHRNARLTFHGRRLLVQRVREQGMPVRMSPRRWGCRASALIVGSPASTPRARPACSTGLRGRIACRRGRRPRSKRGGRGPREHRRGQDWLGPELGVPARTVSRILRRHDVPRLAECDPMTGEVIRASKTTAVRYERDRPGELVHMDVKKIGRIPDGGGWRAHGRKMGSTSARRRRPGSGSTTCTPSSTTTAASRTPRSSPTRQRATLRRVLRPCDRRVRRSTGSRIERVMTDNHWSYTRQHRARRAARRDTGSSTSLIRPHCPWQNGKVERFNRTLQTEWAYRQVFTTNAERTAALAPWLDHYNTRRRHSALGGLPPISRLSPT